MDSYRTPRIAADEACIIAHVFAHDNTRDCVLRTVHVRDVDRSNSNERERTTALKARTDHLHNLIVGRNVFIVGISCGVDMRCSSRLRSR